MSPSLHALKQWVLDHLRYDADLNDFHKLATATMMATSQQNLAAYNPNLPNEAALRCCVSSLSRFLQNDKFPGWGEMGKWNFCASVVGNDMESVRIVLQALKCSCDKNWKGGRPSARPPVQHLQLHYDTGHDDSHSGNHQRTALHVDIQHSASSPPPKPIR